MRPPPAHPPKLAVTPLQPSNGAGLREIPSVTNFVNVTANKPLQATVGAACNGVTDKQRKFSTFTNERRFFPMNPPELPRHLEAPGMALTPGNGLAVRPPRDESLNLPDQADEPQPEELTESAAAWQAWVSSEDQGQPLEKVRLELLHE